MRGILGFFVKFSDFLDFLDLCPPGSPNRLKMMPRGIGSISTPEDFPSAIFEISLFRGHLVISSKKSPPEKSKPYINLEIYCITKNGIPTKRCATSNILESLSLLFKTISWESSYRIFRRKTSKNDQNQGEAKPRVQLLFCQKRDLLFFKTRDPCILKSSQHLQ